MVLLVAAGLLLKSFLRLRSADVGCVTENMLTLQYSLPDKKYETPEKMNAFNEALLAASEEHSWGSRRRTGKHSSRSGILGRLRIHSKGASSAQAGRRPARRAHAMGRSRLFQRAWNSPCEWPVLYGRRTRRSIVQSDCEPSTRPPILSRRRSNRQAPARAGAFPRRSAECTWTTRL